MRTPILFIATTKINYVDYRTKYTCTVLEENRKCINNMVCLHCCISTWSISNLISWCPSCTFLFSTWMHKYVKMHKQKYTLHIINLQMKQCKQMTGLEAQRLIERKLPFDTNLCTNISLSPINFNAEVCHPKLVFIMSTKTYIDNLNMRLMLWVVNYRYCNIGSQKINASSWS